jgi:hypothetical protein
MANRSLKTGSVRAYNGTFADWMIRVVRLGIRDHQAPLGGLCEYVQHLSIFDYICVGASLENRVLEYVDHLHEHFLDPVVIKTPTI